MSYQHTFNHWLKQLRTAQDLTQEMLAEQTGCSVATVSAFERGRRRPSRAMAERLAQVLQVPSSERAEFLRLARAQMVVNGPLPGTDLEDADPAPSPVPRAAGCQSHLMRIPQPATPLIGRAIEEDNVCRRLRDPDCRLLTLVGAGGTGKTRLALQVAVDLSHDFTDGVAFVALAPIMAPENVPAAIADVLGCPLLPTQTAEESLIHFLHDRKLLLILDNMEHLLDATPIITVIMRDAPQVRLLVTSRERLRLRSEWVVELHGLKVPTGENRSAIDQCDAVLLFLERARQMTGAFVLSGSNRGAVAEICRLLDGMPLGIELAAAWARVLAPNEIAAELSRGLDLLQRNDRDADPRHRSMRAVIDQSWALLTADQRRVMACMSVFHGGFLRPAAEAVAATTLQTLLALLDKSLLHRTPAGRYEMHELVRQYAAEQLAADPSEEVSVRNRHCTYYSMWTGTMGTILRSPQQQAAVTAFMAEIDNLRATWQHAVDQREVEPLWRMQQEVALLWFYELRSWYQEGEALCRRAVAALQTLPAMTRRAEILLGSLIGTQGWFTSRNGNPKLGITLLEQSLEVLRSGGDPTLLVHTLSQLSYLMLLNGDFERAVTLTDELQVNAQRIDDPWIKAHAAFIRAVVYVDHIPETAYVRFHEGMSTIQAGGDRYHLILSLIHLGDVALVLGKIDEAEQVFIKALAHSTEVGNGVGEVFARAGLALVACGLEAWADALTHARDAVHRSRDVGDQLSRSKALVALGEAQAGSGDPLAAHNTFHEAIAVSLAARALPMAIDAWLGLATLDLQNGVCHQSLHTLLDLVRCHSATRYATAERAERLWIILTRKLDKPTPEDPRNATDEMAVEQLEPMLMAYAADRLAATKHAKHLPRRSAP